MSEPRLTAEQKRAVAERAGYCCEYCRSQLRFSTDSFSIEHIVPLSAGGPDDMNNLALSCQGCNNRKYTSVQAVDPVTHRHVSLYHPRHQRWSEHFIWSDEFVLMIGLTPTGRATIDKMQLNREGVVNLRRVLQMVGEHPPPEAI